MLAAECKRDIEVLDTFYLATLPPDSEVLVAWKSARNLPGPFRHPQPVPATAPALVPAAA